jgi:hypothetical protein
LIRKKIEIVVAGVGGVDTWRKLSGSLGILTVAAVGIQVGRAVEVS